MLDRSSLNVDFCFSGKTEIDTGKHFVQYFRMTFLQGELKLWKDPDSQPGASPLPPGEYILLELKARGWGQADLATVIGRPISAINDIIQGKRNISPEIAVALSRAFGSVRDLWIHREAAYRLSLVDNDCAETEKRAALFTAAPIKEMQRRGWIDPSLTASEEIEAGLRAFFGDDTSTNAAARKAEPEAEFTNSQRAWLMQATRMAKALTVRPFSAFSLEVAFKRLNDLLLKPELAAHVATILADAGVRFVVVEDLSGTKIDGAAFHLEDKQSEPVVVLSLRIDRMESFWHNLFHELIHIKHGDPISLDVDFAGQDRKIVISEMERIAHEGAAAAVIARDSLESFILRAKPHFALDRIKQFSARLGVHPCLVIGQLQHRGLIGQDRFSEVRPKVRSHVIAGAFTDGYGKHFKLNPHKKPQ